MTASAARNISTRWKTRTSNELNLWSDRFVAKLKTLPELEDVATDQQTGGLAVTLAIDRVTASRLGIAPATIDNTLYDNFGQRQINTMYTQLNQYHVILEAQPQFARRSRQAEQNVHSVERVFRRQRSRSFFVVRLFFLFVGRLQCYLPPACSIRPPPAS